MLNIIGTIIFGAVIGALARLVIPGKQQMGILITIVIGVVGALIGIGWRPRWASTTPGASTGFAGVSASLLQWC